MLDLRTHSDIADATATMMRTCAIAAANAMAQQASQHWLMWTETLNGKAPTKPLPWTLQPAFGLMPAASLWLKLADMNPWLTGAMRAAPAGRFKDPQSDSNTYASYRSAGGHASAQVITATASPQNSYNRAAMSAIDVMAAWRSMMGLR